MERKNRVSSQISLSFYERKAQRDLLISMAGKKQGLTGTFFKIEQYSLVMEFLIYTLFPCGQEFWTKAEDWGEGLKESFLVFTLARECE